LGSGTVFKMTADGGFATIHLFTGDADGGGPTALIRGSDSSLFGTTSVGGQYSAGTLYRFTNTRDLKVLRSFSDPNSDGPNSLVQSGDGTFYGTMEGGANVIGTIFKLTLPGAR
jgi:uncharacterized repeat protein (TIGR03803 family)